MRSTKLIARPNRPSVKRPQVKRPTKGGGGSSGGSSAASGGGGSSTDYSSLAGDASFE